MGNEVFERVLVKFISLVSSLGQAERWSNRYWVPILELLNLRPQQEKLSWLVNSFAGSPISGHAP